MRYMLFVTLCFVSCLSVYASEIDDIEGLRGAVDAHEAALLSGDSNKISETVLYPHVQFYPDGRVVQIGQPGDLPFRSEAQRQWRVSDAVLVMHEPGTAIVRTTFEFNGNTGGAGLWCFRLSGGEWRVYWRHYLGQGADD